MTPPDCLYHKDHLWIRRAGDDEAVVGVTHYAQESLGEVVYVDCPKIGAEIQQGVSFGIIESVKVVSDLVSPVTGTVLSLNGILSDDPCSINRDPYGEGWLLKIKLANLDELSGLMSANDYERYVTGLA